jgi:hypothetical protein
VPERITSAYFEATIETNKRTIAVDGETLTDLIEALGEAGIVGLDKSVVGLPGDDSPYDVLDGMLDSLESEIARGGDMRAVGKWIGRLRRILNPTYDELRGLDADGEALR